MALRRFSDIGLGETIEAPVAARADTAWEANAVGLVRHWSGSSDVRLVHVSPPSPAGRPRELSGRIFARHLDNSGHVDIEVFGWDRGTLCARAVVRTALA